MKEQAHIPDMTPPAQPDQPDTTNAPSAGAPESAPPGSTPTEGGPPGSLGVSETRAEISQINWEELRDEARRTLDQSIPPTPEHQRLGIQDLARVTGLTVQQIRLLEYHGLVSPAFETSGEKRNRRYTREQAELILVAATVIHRLKIRPGKAAMLVLARNLDQDRGLTAPAPAAAKARARPAAFTVPSAVMEEPAMSPSTPGLDLFDVADLKVRRVIAARLAANAVSSLLGERNLPAHWVILVRHSPAKRDGAPPPALAEDAAETPEGVSQFVVLDVTPLAEPDLSPVALDGERAPFLAFVAPEGEVFAFSPAAEPDSRELLHDRLWYSIMLPAARSQSHPQVELIVGTPRNRPSGPGLTAVGQRLTNGRLAVRRHVVAVAAALLWTVAEVVPEVTRTQRQLALMGELDLRILARRGVTVSVLWLYACVLLRMCPGVDQCDVLAPYADTDSGQTVLRLISSSSMDEIRVPTRASIVSGQLLTGFAYSLAQPCYVEDARGRYSALVSYPREEHVRAAAAIPVTHAGRTLACIYLSSRRSSVAFEPHWRRALEVAADEIAEVLLLHDVGRQLSGDSILHAVRPHRIEQPADLRERIQTWVEEQALRLRSAEAARPGARHDEGIPTADQDDRRFVMVVIGADAEPHFREQPEIVAWLDGVARQAADSLAEALDAGTAEEHPTHQALDLGPHFDGADDAAERPPSLTRVFRWETTADELPGSASVAYIVLAGDHYTRQHIERLKSLLHTRGLDGRVTAHTETATPVGRVLGWVLDTKGSVVQRTLRAARDRLGGRELDTQPVVRQMLRDIRTCVRTLSHQHQFHEEAFRQGNLNRAIVTLKQALLLSGQDVYVLRHLLDLYVRTGRLDEALALAETHKDREDLMPAKWFWSLGQVYLMRDDPEEAIDQFWQAIRRDPSHPQAYRLMAEAHVARGDLREAEDWLRHAIAREESRSLRGVEQIGRIIDTYLLLGDVLVKQDQLDAAIATYEELLVTHPEEAKDNILVSQRLASTRLLRRRAQT